MQWAEKYIVAVAIGVKVAFEASPGVDFVHQGVHHGLQDTQLCWQGQQGETKDAATHSPGETMSDESAHKACACIQEGNGSEDVSPSQTG